MSIFSTNSSYTFTALPAHMNPAPSAASFTVNELAFEVVHTFLNLTFNGSISLFGTGRAFDGSDIILVIWNRTDSATDLDAWMNNVAVSMTNVIRASNVLGPDSYERYYDGTSFHLGYEIRWVWITLPAILVVMSILILAITMFETAKNPI